MTKHTFEDVTLCMPGEFSGAMQTRYCKTLSVELRPYAQYAEACSLRWRQPRQRLDRGVVKTTGRVVIVAGNQTAKLEQQLETPWRETRPGVSVCEWRHTSFSPAWLIEWREQLKASGVETLFDWESSR